MANVVSHFWNPLPLAEDNAKETIGAWAPFGQKKLAYVEVYPSGPRSIPHSRGPSLQLKAYPLGRSLALFSRSIPQIVGPSRSRSVSFIKDYPFIYRSNPQSKPTQIRVLWYIPQKVVYTKRYVYYQP